ncbi:uncharacterized protein [Phyllobates terribilis]|uniref:uncharacterized protein isoform X3 n=1 Tax=Phyllobates terribilis TaxID=111132 RepID=UPI003CCA90BD
MVYNNNNIILLFGIFGSRRPLTLYTFCSSLSLSLSCLPGCEHFRKLQLCSSRSVVIMSYFSCLICGSFSSPRVVGIFSRSATVDYEWLMTALKSSMFTGLVAEPQPVYISNRDEHRFQEAVQDCDFAILYHTKNRGRINIINVTDSIYDEELTYMASSKGRDNVIVLVDDLEKSDYLEKCRILDGQPDITMYSRDLILVTSNEKRQPQLLGQKLQDIKANISAGSSTSVNMWNYLESMAVWVRSNVSAVWSSPAVKAWMKILYFKVTSTQVEESSNISSSPEN